MTNTGEHEVKRAESELATAMATGMIAYFGDRAWDVAFAQMNLSEASGRGAESWRRIAEKVATLLAFDRGRRR